MRRLLENSLTVQVGSAKVYPKDVRRVLNVLRSNQISPGPLVREFEEAFAASHHLKHAVFMNSGTDALRLALLTLKEVHGWQDGDEVLVPAITFVATINVVLQCNLKPVLVDVGMHDYAMNPWRLLPMEVGDRKESNMIISSRARCMIVAHLFGQPAQMGRLLDVARHYKLKMIEDSCETMFAQFQGQMVGTFGDISCFSTYVAHILSTGVGGLACTQNERYATVLRSFVNHGRDPAYLPGYSQTKDLRKLIEKRFRYERIGYSSRATELQAALGLGELERAPKMIARRQAIAQELNQALHFLRPILALPYKLSDRDHVYMMYPLVIKDTTAGQKIKKRHLMHHLEKCGIETRDMMPITTQPCYQGRFPPENFPTAKWINDCGFYIGCHPHLTPQDLQRIVRAFKTYRHFP